MLETAYMLFIGYLFGEIDMTYLPPIGIHKVSGNFISSAVDRIEKRLKENKSSIKTYASHERAFDIAEKEAQDFSAYNQTDFDPIFMVTQVSTGRWAIVFMLSDYCRRLDNGTDITHFARRGFFCI